MRSVQILLLAVVSGLILCPLVFGQSTASVHGRVTDPSGAVITNASVQLLRVDTNVTRETSTNSEGFYEIVQLAPGSYRLTVAASGFAIGRLNYFSATVNVPVTADFIIPVD